MEERSITLYPADLQHIKKSAIEVALEDYQLTPGLVNKIKQTNLKTTFSWEVRIMKPSSQLVKKRIKKKWSKPPGSGKPRKVPDHIVRFIRSNAAKHYSVKQIAKLINVSENTVSRIRNKLSYFDIPAKGHVWKPDIEALKKLKQKKKVGGYKQSKLTDEQIRYIRANPDQLTGSKLAKLFSMSTSQALQIRRKHSCADVSDQGPIWEPDPEQVEKIRNETRNKNYTITDEQVRYIRANPDQLSALQLSKLIGVAQSTVNNIRCRSKRTNTPDQGPVWKPTPEALSKIK